MTTNFTQAQLKKKACELRAEYLRAWRRRNPEKTRQHAENVWLRKAEKALREEAGQSAEQPE